MYLYISLAIAFKYENKFEGSIDMEEVSGNIDSQLFVDWEVNLLCRLILPKFRPGGETVASRELSSNFYNKTLYLVVTLNVGGECV